MALLRFRLDLAVPTKPAAEAGFTFVPALGVAIPTALATNLTDIRQKIQTLKSFAVRINTGAPNEEITVNARYHICNHDTGGSCGTESDI